MGVGGSGELFLYGQPDSRSIQELRGKTVIVDAPDTAFALLLYKMLKVNGLIRDKDYKVEAIGGTPLRFEAMVKNQKYAAAMMNNPFTFLADKKGFNNLGLAEDVVGTYQNNVAFVLKKWATANSKLLVSFVQAYIEGLRWVTDAAHRDEMIGIIAKEFNLDSETATKCYRSVVDPIHGITKDASISLEGFENAMKLRAELEGAWGGNPPPLKKYYDLRYYNVALKGM
jgi:ABC-type nitrate/sulfonate/bicarbonate transport system substrate-binding protein